MDHEYSEISEEFQTASNCPSSKKEDSVIRNTSTDSEEDDIVSSSSEETQSTFIPKLPSQNYLQVMHKEFWFNALRVSLFIAIEKFMSTSPFCH